MVAVLPRIDTDGGQIGQEQANVRAGRADRTVGCRVGMALRRSRSQRCPPPHHRLMDRLFLSTA